MITPTFRVRVLQFAAICAFSAVPLLAQESTSARERQLQKKEREVEAARQDLEKKRADLEAAQKELQVQKAEGRLTFRLQGDVLFDYGKSALRPEAEAALQKLAIVLSQFPKSKVIIRGYSDAKGDAKANLALSRDRAAAVKTWLVKRQSVSAANVSTVGLGEKDPVALNKNPDGSDNPDGRQQNRRVEVTVENASVR